MAEIPGLQGLYDQMLVSWRSNELSDRALFGAGTWIAHFIGYWFINALLYVVYHFDLFAQYKIQPAQKWPPWALVKRCLLDRGFSTIVAQPIFFTYLYNPFKKFGLDVDTPIPSLWTFLWQITFWFIVNDALFYWAHRALHHPLLYGRIHKQHHLFKQTIGIAAEFAHPIEEMIANGIPTFLPPMLTHCHVTVFWFYFAVRMWETVDAHSGYRFPWSPWAMLDFIQGGAGPHDWHHSHGHKNGNFGMLKFWDWLCGTDQAYKKWLLESKTDVKKQWDDAEPLTDSTTTPTPTPTPTPVVAATGDETPKDK